MIPDPASDIPPLRPRRRIHGASAVLLPFRNEGGVDWPAFEAHVARTRDAGLVPALNMDTGYVQLLDAATRARVLDTGRDLCGAEFIAGAFVADRPGDPFDPGATLAAMESIARRGGLPVVFPCHGLRSLDEVEVVEAHRALGRRGGRFLAFELGEMFVPFGRIYRLETFAGLMEIDECVGAKHSSLRREDEWQRLALRDARRPDFYLFTGNDLAIDMVMWGSDYLLGLSTFAPDLFARRDGLWESGAPGFFELNDRLQYLGAFTFRAPVPAYRHSAAQFLRLRGWLTSEATPAGAQRRPDSDVEVLREIAAGLGIEPSGRP